MFSVILIMLTSWYYMEWYGAMGQRGGDALKSLT